MLESILTSVKKVLGVVEADTSFDEDILLHINSVFGTLHQLGIGPTTGFQIESADTTWDAYLGSELPLNPVKTYICLRVRMLFDPPQTGHHVNAMEKQITELEWRLNLYREERDYVWPE